MRISITRKWLAAFLSGILLVSCTACGSGGKTESSDSGNQTSEATSTTGDAMTEDTGTTDTSSMDTSSGNTTNQNPSNGGTVSTNQNSKPTTPGTSFKKPKYDLKGREIVIWGTTAPKKGEIWYESWKDVEAEYNCKLKFTKVSYSVAVQKMTAGALSGTAECDIWNAQWYDTFPSFVAKGMAAPLSDHYAFSKDPNWQGDGNRNNFWNGKLYGLNTGTSGPGWGLWYNKSMLRAANLKDPADLVKQGKWNWTTFLDMCQKLTKTSGGNTTQWGYYDEYLFMNLILTNGGEMIDIDNKSGPKFTMNSEATKYAMRFAIDLANKYKVVPSIGSIGDSNLLEMFPKGKVAFTTYGPGYGPVCVSKGMNVKDLGYTYFPKGPNAKDYVLHAPTLDPVYIIPPQVKNIAAITCVLQDYLCVWDASEKFAVSKNDLLDIAFSGTEYKEIYKNNKDFILNGGKKNKPSYVNNFFLGETLNTGLFYPLLKGEVNVDTGVKKIAASVQTKVDELVMQSMK